MEGWNRGEWILRDRTLHALELLLDEAFRIPRTGIRFGLNGIIGLLPGLGDGVVGCFPSSSRWLCGCAAFYVTLAGMAVNIAAGVLVGSIPLLDDILDIAGRRIAATTVCCSYMFWSGAATPGATGPSWRRLPWGWLSFLPARPC